MNQNSLWSAVDKFLFSLNGLVNILGNGAIIALIPDPYKAYVLIAFNLIHVLYAFAQNPSGTPTTAAQQ